MLASLSIPSYADNSKVRVEQCPGSSPAASHSTITQQATPSAVLRVTDGDTLILTDSRRVRLIGLNTLELHSRSESDRRWAEAAAQALTAAIDGQNVTLIEGIDRQDRHGRTLAHVLVKPGINAALILVEAGLAVAVTIGQNTRCTENMFRLENTARLARQGIWREPGDWFVKAPRLKGNEQGFHVLESRVQKIGGSLRSPTLILSNGLKVRLGRRWTDWIARHKAPQSHELLGKRIELRGWLSASAGQVSMTLHHPDNVRVLSN